LRRERQENAARRTSDRGKIRSCWTDSHKTQRCCSAVTYGQADFAAENDPKSISAAGATCHFRGTYEKLANGIFFARA
jgi:hypothetical protein